MASLISTTSRRSASAFCCASSPSSSLASSSSGVGAPFSLASGSRCPHQSTSSASVSPVRLFSSSSAASGKSRPGEGKDAKRAIRRAQRLGGQSPASAVRTEAYTLSNAVRLLKATQINRPLSAFEVHIVTSVPRNQSNALRGRIAYPHSPAIKVPTIVIFAPEGTPAYEAAQAAQSSGQKTNIILGGEGLITQVASGQVANIDKVLASPDIMPALSKALARSLGPKGLMPNVKRGTVAESAAEMTNAIEQAMGASDWRGDKNSVVRAAIGRVNFNEEQVRANMQAILSSIVERATSGLGGGTSTAKGQAPTALKIAPRPAGVPAPLDVIKKASAIIKQLHLSSTQGQGIQLDLRDCL